MGQFNVETLELQLTFSMKYFLNYLQFIMEPKTFYSQNIKLKSGNNSTPSVTSIK